MKLDGFPNLVLISEPTRAALRASKSATHPPFKGTVISYFPDWTPDEIEDFLLQNQYGDAISRHIFAIVDRQTLVDNTVILAQRWWDPKKASLDIVRLAAINLNADAISVEVGVMTVAELVLIEDGRNEVQSPSGEPVQHDSTLRLDLSTGTYY